jgi:hypothetical protein
MEPKKQKEPVRMIQRSLSLSMVFVLVLTVSGVLHVCAEDVVDATSLRGPRLSGIEEVPIAPRSRWQNPYCERVIGSIRRECLDRVIVLNKAHLKRILTDYFEYYHDSRPHLSLDRNSPTPREVEPPSQGEVISIRQVGGLHHRYSHAA